MMPTKLDEVALLLKSPPPSVAATIFRMFAANNRSLFCIICSFTVLLQFAFLYFFISISPGCSVKFASPYAGNLAGKSLASALSAKQFMNGNKPIILLWTKYYGERPSRMFPPPLKCPFQCIFTEDRSAVDIARIRVFYYRDVHSRDLPPANAAALNLLFIVESPTFSYFKHGGVPDDFFNISMTYRSTSDIPFPTDTFVPINGDESPDEVFSSTEVDRAIQRKTKAVLIAVSHCGAPSGRDEYITELSKHIEITTVGRCYGHDCDNKCLDKLVAEHHFYLAFENSVCPEYTTEKFWRLKNLTVPIVLSRGVVPLSVPPQTFIAASDFDSPKHLAAHLKSLINDKDMYRHYFDWTKKYRRTTSPWEARTCQLCALANGADGERHYDFRRFWTRDECVKDYGLKIMSPNVTQRHSAEGGLANTVRQTFKWRPTGSLI